MSLTITVKVSNLLVVHTYYMTVLIFKAFHIESTGGTSLTVTEFEKSNLSKFCNRFLTIQYQLPVYSVLYCDLLPIRTDLLNNTYFTGFQPIGTIFHSTLNTLWVTTCN